MRSQSKKMTPTHAHIFLLNADQLSELFHWHTLWTTCNKMPLEIPPHLKRVVKYTFSETAPTKQKHSKPCAEELKNVIAFLKDDLILIKKAHRNSYKFIIQQAYTRIHKQVSYGSIFHPDLGLMDLQMPAKELMEANCYLELRPSCSIQLLSDIISM